MLRSSCPAPSDSMGLQLTLDRSESSHGSRQKAAQQGDTTDPQQQSAGNCIATTPGAGAPGALRHVDETAEIPGRVPGNLTGYVLQARYPSTKTGACVFIHRASKTCGRFKHGHMLRCLQGRPCKDSEKHEQLGTMELSVRSSAAQYAQAHSVRSLWWCSQPKNASLLKMQSRSTERRPLHQHTWPTASSVCAGPPPMPERTLAVAILGPSGSRCRSRPPTHARFSNRTGFRWAAWDLVQRASRCSPT